MPKCAPGTAGAMRHHGVDLRRAAVDEAVPLAGRPVVRQTGTDQRRPAPPRRHTATRPLHQDAVLRRRPKAGQVVCVNRPAYGRGLEPDFDSSTMPTASRRMGRGRRRVAAAAAAETGCCAQHEALQRHKYHYGVMAQWQMRGAWAPPCNVSLLRAVIGCTRR